MILETPRWQPAAVERNGQPSAGGIYTVQPGDSLYKVVRETGASFSDIVAANGLAEPYILQVGQQLQIPTGIYHTINAGETGIAIARAYGAKWSDIVNLNGLQEPFILRVGQKLKLPDSAGISNPALNGGPIGPSPEELAAGFSLDIDDIVTGGEPAIASDPAALPQGLALSQPIQRPSRFSGSFVWPVNGRLLSSFGSKGGGKVNNGIDIAAARGTAVGAAGDGIVVYSGNEIGVFGGLILIDHGSGWVTAYGHLGELKVARGDSVKAGQTLGSVGDTGYVTTPQLHFEIRKDRKPLNPVTKLPRA